MILCAKRPGGFPSKFIELIIEGLGHSLWLNHFVSLRTHSRVGPPLSSLLVVGHYAWSLRPRCFP